MSDPGKPTPPPPFDRTTPAPDVTPTISPLLKLISKAPAPDLPAQGFVEDATLLLVPYRVDRPSMDGDVIHFWIGTRDATHALLIDICQIAQMYHEPVRFTYSSGLPKSFESYALRRRKL